MRNILLYGIAILMMSCYETEKPEKPENLIEKDQIVNIMIDMALVNSAKGINKKILENEGLLPEQYIYRKYHIDSLQFAESNNYYAYRVEEYEDIVNRVTDSLEKLKEVVTVKIQREEEEMRKLKDSTRQIKDSVRTINKDSLKQQRIRGLELAPNKPSDSLVI